MQFIFATHNANIPVLGDSEKVIACTYIDEKEIEIHAGTTIIIHNKRLLVSWRAERSL